MQPAGGPHVTLRWHRLRQFEKETAKLKLAKGEVVRVQAIMSRYAEGRAFPKDHKVLRDGVEELKIAGYDRTFRVHFGRVDDELVLLCLHFSSKKTQVDAKAIDLAAARLRQFKNDNLQ